MNVSATCEDEKWTLHELNFELDRDLADKKFIIYRHKAAATENGGYLTVCARLCHTICVCLRANDNLIIKLVLFLDGQQQVPTKPAAATDDSKKSPQSKE